MSEYPEFSTLFIDGGLGAARRERDAKSNAARLRTSTRRLGDESLRSTATSVYLKGSVAQAAAVRELKRRGL